MKGVVGEATTNSIPGNGNSSAATTMAVNPPPSSASTPLHKAGRNGLCVDTDAVNAQHASDGGPNDPKTPPGVRGHLDLRSPGVAKTPMAAALASPANGGGLAASADPAADDGGAAVPDFITQTDRYGNATTPRSADAITSARAGHPTGPRPNLRVDAETEALVEGDKQSGGTAADCGPVGAEGLDDPCDSLLDSFRMMCCCLLPEDGAQSSTGGGAAGAGAGNGAALAGPDGSLRNPDGSPGHPPGYSTRGHDAPLLLEEDSALRNGDNPDRIRLLPELHKDDLGKKCLVLDLDETLVHSSFRAVPGADFVLPVQIEDVVHFVYVTKRPNVDQFLIEMAKHYEIVVYTASLNKYADVLLDLLDPHRTIRTRLFRESCVYYEGNYVKDMSLINRDLSQAIIIDNSPASYLFHPENAIDCSSFIDDVSDRELDQIGRFLVGIKDVDDVRGVVNLWRHWPNVDLTKNHYRIR
mmetsp:Transcript_33529/g.76556  ORF Transcript_33529/g.76556 Transcript_33529/m.76556 type:complete len:470 (-) Transcript_33529:275-1684(-)